jgi:hypothetical protein
MRGAIHPLPQYAFMAWCSIKNQNSTGTFTFTFLLPGTLSLGVKRPGREADHSPPSSVEVKE